MFQTTLGLCSMLSLSNKNIDLWTENEPRLDKNMLNL